MIVRRCVPILAGVVSLALLPAAVSSAAAEIPLASYRSVHDFAMGGGGDMADGVTIRSRLVTEFIGSACEGYVTKMRFVTRTSGGDGEARTDDMRSELFETTDGLFEFRHDVYTDDELTETTAGTARREGGAIAVELSQPAERTLTFDGDVAFPTEQVVRSIEAAREGKRFVAFETYDGTEGGETVYQTANVIGQPSTSADDLGEETAVADAGFADQRHWPLTISYFLRPSGGEMTPDYVMSLIVYENGVPRDIRLDYGTFELVGKLTGLELLPSPPCAG